VGTVATVYIIDLRNRSRTALGWEKLCLEKCKSGNFILETSRSPLDSKFAKKKNQSEGTTDVT